MHGEYLHAAGVPRAVIAALAARLGVPLVTQPDPEDEDGELLTIGPWRAAVHDGCFTRLDSVDPSVCEGFVTAVVELHEYYLGRPVGPAGVAAVRTHLRDGVTLELQTDPSRGELLLRRYPNGAGWWARRTAPVEQVPLGGTR